MKHRLRTYGLIAAGLLLAACSTAATDRFVDRIANFNRGVEAVDDAIAKTSAKLYARCKDMQAIATAADEIAGQCTKASPVVSVGNSVIRTFCQAPPDNIASAVTSVATSVSASKSELAAAKRQCAAGS